MIFRKIEIIRDDKLRRPEVTIRNFSHNSMPVIEVCAVEFEAVFHKPLEHSRNSHQIFRELIVTGGKSNRTGKLPIENGSIFVRFFNDMESLRTSNQNCQNRPDDLGRAGKGYGMSTGSHVLTYAYSLGFCGPSTERTCLVRLSK